MARNTNRVVLLIATIVLGAVCGICTAKTVVVGGTTTGWNIPPFPSFYSSWASQQNLQVGDVLVFNFPTGAHTVAEVTKSNYDSCTTTSTIGPVITTAPANITLTKPGSHYFICTIPTHCSLLNQKLTVTAASSSPSVPAPAPKASPPSKKSPTPSPKPSPLVPTPTSSPVPAPSTLNAPDSRLASTAPNGSPGGLHFPLTPVASDGPGGIGSSPPPAAGNFATSTGVTMLSLLSFVAASALLF